MDLCEYQLILLRRPARPPQYDGAESDRIQREHVAFYERMRAEGHVVTNGPVGDQPDEALRGMAVFAAPSLARARELAQADPAVTAGRLEVEAMTWLCRPGTMVAPGNPVTVPDP